MLGGDGEKEEEGKFVRGRREGGEIREAGKVREEEEDMGREGRGREEYYYTKEGGGGGGGRKEGKEGVKYDG